MSAQHFDSFLHLMEVQGGSFVKALAHAYLVADPGDRGILRSAFSHYFMQYETRFANLPRRSCSGHEQYASDCGGCYHANVAKATGEAS